MLARAANRIIAENNLCLPVLQDLRMGFFLLDPATSYLLGHAAIILGNLLRQCVMVLGPTMAFHERGISLQMLCSLHALK